jgi:hypothetical protein
MRREGMQRGEPPCQVKPNAHGGRRGAVIPHTTCNLLWRRQYRVSRGDSATGIAEKRGYGDEQEELRERQKGVRASRRSHDFLMPPAGIFITEMMIN